MKKKKELSPVMKEVLDYVRIILIVAVVVLIVNNFLVINARIPSGSMENTIMEGDRIFGNRLVYDFSDPERYDIVIFRYPDDPSQLFIKRVIGLPGETVEIRDGKVYIDGSDTPLEDDFIAEKIYEEDDDWGPYEVPEGCYFVMGDNRFDSCDSRYWENHYVSRDAILAQAWFRYFPFNKIGTVE